MITFDKENHAYYKDGDIKPSVSQILDRVFGSKFDEIKDNPFVIRARDKGTLIHMFIDNYNKSKVSPEFPIIELENYKKLCKENKFKFDKSEYQFFCDFLGGYCGTVDLIDTKNKLVSDVKTGSKKDIDRWTYQLSLYAYALNKNGIEIKKANVLWLHNDINEVLEIELLADVEVENIIKSYYNNETLKEVVSAELATVNAEISTKITQSIQTIEKLEKDIKLFKKMVLNEMEEKGIKKFDNGEISITYIEPYNKNTVDSKKLKEELPDVYKKYSKESEVKASVKIVKKEIK